MNEKFTNVGWNIISFDGLRNANDRKLPNRKKQMAIALSEVIGTSHTK